MDERGRGLRREGVTGAARLGGGRAHRRSVRLGVGGVRCCRRRRGEWWSWEELRWSGTSPPSSFCGGGLRLNCGGGVDNVERRGVEEGQGVEGSKIV
jgi:hypothetical protein